MLRGFWISDSYKLNLGTFFMHFEAIITGTESFGDLSPETP